MTDHPTSNGGRLLARGDTFDIECGRTTHRLRLGQSILRHVGIEATYVDHDPKCIKNPANRSQRVFGYDYACSPGCPRGTYQGERPQWPEWATGRMFDLAYELACTVQTNRGNYNRSRAS